MCGRVGFAVSLQRIQTCSGGWYYPCAICRDQNCVYSPVLRRRQQWKNCEITGRFTSVDAVQFRLQDTHHSNLTRPPLVHHEMRTLSQRCISSRQMTENIFEIETTALADVACATQESGILLTDFAAAYPSVNHSWIFHVLEKPSCLSLSAVSCEGCTTTAPHMWNSQE